MGDRVLFQVFKLDPPDLKGEVSPVIYGHWLGGAAPAVCKKIKERMLTRRGDIEYTAARLVQEITEGNTGNTGVGIWNHTELLNQEDSHGDAGVVLIQVSDTSDMKFICMGGYLEVDNQTGLPREKSEEVEEHDKGFTRF